MKSPSRYQTALKVLKALKASTALTLAALCLASLHASTPKFFQAQTQSDFLRGEVENLSIDLNGQLTLGPATGRLMAEMITGATPFCDPAPYAAERFSR